MEDKEYQQLVKSIEPPIPYLKNATLAFLVGGAVCTLGQWVLNSFVAMGFGPEDAAAPTSVVMVFLAASLTALGLYDRIATWAGMGTALPITGFANSVVAPAMEFRREGLVLGTGARMFQLAGPVIAFGMATAFLVGLVLLIMIQVRG